MSSTSNCQIPVEAWLLCVSPASPVRCTTFWPTYLPWSLSETSTLQTWAHFDPVTRWPRHHEGINLPLQPSGKRSGNFLRFTVEMDQCYICHLLNTLSNIQCSAKITIMIMLHNCIGYFPMSSLNYDNSVLKELGSLSMCLPMPQSLGTKPLDKLQNA